MKDRKEKKKEKERKKVFFRELAVRFCILSCEVGMAGEQLGIPNWPK